MGDVIDLNPGPTNRQCSECGGEWWLTDGVVVDLEGHVTGYAAPLRCMTCAGGGQLRSLQSTDSGVE